MAAELYRIADQVSPTQRVVAALGRICDRECVANNSWTRCDGEGAARENVIPADCMTE